VRSFGEIMEKAMALALENSFYNMMIKDRPEKYPNWEELGRRFRKAEAANKHSFTIYDLTDSEVALCAIAGFCFDVTFDPIARRDSYLVTWANKTSSYCFR
jgi:hypothetical protein